MTDLTKTLSRLGHLNVPASKQATYQAVSLKVSTDDWMYTGNDHHYLSVGLSAITIIQANQELAQAPDFKSILDFGSGAGRVTRWFRAAYPNAQITTADLRERDLDFCISEFGSTRWVTSTDLQRLVAPQTYDLVWMGSVLTHLSADNSRLLMQKAMGWCNDKGLYVTSFHGRYAYSVRQNQYYVPDLSKLPEIEKGFETSDYGYADYPDSVGYGVSFTDPSWVISQAKKLPCRIISMSERVWDSNHDVLGVQHVTPN